jgi:uncharacterized membrane protein
LKKGKKSIESIRFILYFSFKNPLIKINSGNLNLSMTQLKTNETKVERFLSQYGITLAIGFGFLLRLIHAGARSLRFEEGLTAQIVREDLTGVIRGSTQNSTPVVFHLLVHYMVALFGNSELAMTLISILAGVGTIWVIYLFGRRYFSAEVGFVAAVIAAISPYLVYYSQEIRPYSLLNFFAFSSAYLFMRALETNQFKYWLSVLLLNVLTVYTQSLGWLVIIAESLFYLINIRHYLKMWLGWLTTTVLTGVYYLPQNYFNQMLTSKMGWQFTPEVPFFPIPPFIAFFFKRLIGTIMHYFGGYYFLNLSGSEVLGYLKSPIDGPALIGMTIIPMLLIGAAAIYLWKNRKRENLYLILLFAIPFALIWMLGTSPKYYTQAFAPLTIICAIGLLHLKKWLRAIAIGGLILASSVALFNIYSLSTSSYTPEDPRGLSQFVAQNKKGTDITMMVGGLNGCHTWRYYNPTGVIYGNKYWSEHFFGIVPAMQPDEYLKPAQFHSMIDPLLDKYTGVWLVMQTSQHRTIEEMLDQLKDSYLITLHNNRDWLGLAEIRRKD